MAHHVGQLRLEVQPVELPMVVQGAVATVLPAAHARVVHIHTCIDARVTWILGDRDRLQQVVWNLLSNAVKFTPAGGDVRLHLTRTDTGVELQVSDIGVGICDTFLPHVFEHFQQADASTSRMAGGLGLGLAIVRHLVEMRGGTVEAASEGEGRGATFLVRLPVVEESSAARASIPAGNAGLPLVDIGQELSLPHDATRGA